MSLEILRSGDDDFVVAGYASVGIEDSHGDTITPDMIRESAARYAKEHRVIYYSHRRDAPAGLILPEYRAEDGKMHETHMDEVGWYVVSRPSIASEHHVREQIAEGLLTGHSIKAHQTRGGKFEITDLSYVVSPANRLAYHKIISSKSEDIHARVKGVTSFAEGAKLISEYMRSQK